MADSPPRYPFIDLLRFVAAFFMVQGHVFDAVLSTAVRSHPLFYLHDFFHGFVAPAFLFASGVAFGASTMKQWNEHVEWGARPSHRVRRFLGLIAIGYALHLPYFSLRKTMTVASPAEIQTLLQSDVLQCIGVTLLLLQIAILLLKSRTAFEWTVAAIACGVLLSAPVMWSARFSGYLPRAIVAYLTPESGSWFPLFPWSAYILCGVMFGCRLVNARHSEDTSSVMSKYAMLNVGVLLLALAVMHLPFDLYSAHDFWKANPAMFFARVSAVGLVVNVIWLAERGWGATPRLPSIIGRETLFVYVLHLLIVYGSVANRGLAQLVGPTLQIAQALGVFAVVFIAIGLVAFLWHRCKTSNERLALRITFAGAASFLLIFTIRPW